MIGVSFAMTSDAYADGGKTETRRFWKPQHAAKFKPGTVFMGWTKDPRAGGARMHPARVVFCRRELLRELTEDSFLREGGTRYWRDRDDYITRMGGGQEPVWVMRFEHLQDESGGTLLAEPLGSHASLGCPECDRLCKPHTQRPNGSCTYVCSNRNGHADFRDLTFSIDSDGELYF